MLHTDFKGHQLFGSREEDFFKGVYHIMRVWMGFIDY